MVLSYKASRGVRRSIDLILLRLPVSKTIVTASVMAFITEYFSLLLNVGIDVLHSLDVLKESIRNEVYQEKLAGVTADIRSGEPIGQAFKSASIFPVFVVRMIHVGEQSGTLPEQLGYIAEDYRNRLSVVVSTIGKIIEPVVLVVAGTMFAIIVGGLFLPIYDLVSKLSG
jgi:general secretion pathway protein F/type IV pilus assembly protein PilC